jgi:transposase
MGLASSEDLRKRVVEAYRAGRGSYREIAELFSVGEASVSRWLRLFREKQSLSPEPHGGGVRPKIAPSQRPQLEALVAEKPDRTVQELRDEWQRRHGVDLSRSAMQRALLKAGYRWKKNGFVRPNNFARMSRSDERRS